MTNPASRVSRRRIVQSGVIGAASMAGGLLSLPALLQADQIRTNSKPRSCIFIYQYGGLSQLDSWDPKPNAPAEVRGPYKPIATATPGFQVSELMPRLALLSNKYCVIRSMSHSVPVHNIANEMLLAGSSAPRKDSPSLGSIISKVRPSQAAVPSQVWLQKFGGGAAPADSSYLTGGFLGMGHAPMLVGERHDDNPGTPGYQVRAFESADDLLLPRIGERWRLLKQLQSGDHSYGAATSFESMQERAYSMLHGPDAKRAFDVEQERPEVRDRYGRHVFGQNLLMARRLLEAGVRLVNVVAWMGLAPNDKFVSVETWDMHGNAGIGIFDNGWNGLGYALPRADASVATLLEDLEERGLLDSTLVVLVGEFGRTPKISRGASAIGRDHWPNCYSAMLAGGGIPGGTVYGSSDDTAAWVRDMPVRPEDFGATVLASLGIDPSTRLSPDGFTLPASAGQPLPFVV
ncbi:MAG: DUF1501 domain-containing protein [Planctomycetaceae bacterium]|nr:DUF1501 domain-containing protein [Planctomycetaceae bacterium]